MAAIGAEIALQRAVADRVMLNNSACGSHAGLGCNLIGDKLVGDDNVCCTQHHSTNSTESLTNSTHQQMAEVGKQSFPPDLDADVVNNNVTASRPSLPILIHPLDSYEPRVRLSHLHPPRPPPSPPSPSSLPLHRFSGVAALSPLFPPLN